MLDVLLALGQHRQLAPPLLPAGMKGMLVERLVHGCCAHAVSDFCMTVYFKCTVLSGVWAAERYLLLTSLGTCSKAVLSPSAMSSADTLHATRKKTWPCVKAYDYFRIDTRCSCQTRQGASADKLQANAAKFLPPCWTHQIQTQPNQSWARCSVFITPPVQKRILYSHA